MRSVFAALALFMFAAAPATGQARYSEGYADLVERLSPAVVNIATRQRVAGMENMPRLPGRAGERQGQAAITSLGSGFIISADGIVVTNNHVIEAADAIDVILQNGESFEARVLGRDPATDIAVLRIAPQRPLPFVNLGDSETARVGDIVLAIGNPFGLGGSLSVGVVSARNRNIDAGRYDDFIQTDAAINQGNSGGPLFNLAGDVIGVNTAILSASGTSVGIGFATPTSIVAPVVEQIIRFGETRRGWLGVRLANLTPDVAERAGWAGPGGAVITRISPDGPAQSAGLRAGDVVVRFGGRDVADSRALTRMVGESAVGSSVELEIMREGRRQTISASIERLIESDGGARIASGGTAEHFRRDDGGPRSGRVFGVALSELDPSLREQFQIEPDVRGLVVLSVDEAAANQGVLREGDVIEAMAFQPVDSMASARAIAARVAVGESAFVVRINRDGGVTYRRLVARR